MVVMAITERRLSELADIMCQHISNHRTGKALLIAQYLRHITGFTLRNLPHYTTGD